MIESPPQTDSGSSVPSRLRSDPSVATSVGGLDPPPPHPAPTAAATPRRTATGTRDGNRGGGRMRVQLRAGPAVGRRGPRSSRAPGAERSRDDPALRHPGLVAPLVDVGEQHRPVVLLGERELERLAPVLEREEDDLPAAR